MQLLTGSGSLFSLVLCCAGSMLDQMAPSEDPLVETLSTEESPELLTAPQLWRRRGSCPRGTVPVRRSKKSDGAKRAPFRKKKPTVSSSLRSTPADDEGNRVPNLLRVNRSVCFLVPTSSLPSSTENWISLV